MILYHTGFQQIRDPDIRRGRRNADFGQGFYLSPDIAFAEKWARERAGMETVVNTYELDEAGLRLRRFDRDEAWFDYIFRNRAGFPDALAEEDVIIGPIANDTIYDVWGITTSGLLARAVALRALRQGPEYTQAVIKTERARAQLRWIGARTLTHGEIAAWRETVRREEEAFQAGFLAAINEAEEG